MNWVKKSFARFPWWVWVGMLLGVVLFIKVVWSQFSKVYLYGIAALLTIILPPIGLFMWLWIWFFNSQMNAGQLQASSEKFGASRGVMPNIDYGSM